jgi:hypothetical protein
MVRKGDNFFGNHHENNDTTGTPILRISQFVVKLSTGVLKIQHLEAHIFVLYISKKVRYFFLLFIRRTVP